MNTNPNRFRRLAFLLFDTNRRSLSVLRRSETRGKGDASLKVRIAAHQLKFVGSKGSDGIADDSNAIMIGICGVI
jgi:hypothetical protein